jgi:pyruvate kinase
MSEVTAAGAEVAALRAEMTAVAARSKELLAAVAPEHGASALNLIHYLTLRRRDLRPLQAKLSALGLSSLGRAEAQILRSVDTVQYALSALEAYGTKPSQAAAAGPVERPTSGAALEAYAPGKARDLGRLLDANTDALLGKAPLERRVRIMVTMPSEAAADYTLVRRLVEAGMDCMRINCAHDDAAAWGAMIEHLRRANRELGRSCRVAMDLAGPKIRTGPIAAGTRVVKLRPQRDECGRVLAPARVWLVPQNDPGPFSAGAVLPVPRRWLAELGVGESLRFNDARGARRELRVVEVAPHRVLCEASRTAYLLAGIKLRRERLMGSPLAGAIGDLPPREPSITLRAGDALIIHRGSEPGREAGRDANGGVTPASIGCTLPQVLDDVRCGARIWLDDGKIGGRIETVDPERIVVRIDHARPIGEKLRADKGINLPDTAPRVPALTAKDIADLEFVVRHADIVSLSFANEAADVETLQRHLHRLGGDQLGIILKIETRRGFENLPEMLFAALRSGRCGVMIARGDLAVECGFERLAEVQEEILWVCEAAHIPVIWATQVLENLAKEGRPSRAEITDAAMSERAECVMLNKGPHICEAVHLLDGILRRMQAHVLKKRSMLRELRLARRFPPEAGAGNASQACPSTS